MRGGASAACAPSAASVAWSPAIRFCKHLRTDPVRFFVHWYLSSDVGEVSPSSK